ncbi:DUF6531 domain-containing protein [Streptomyces sp. NPDC004296]|uniref:DUF6531 domain-containing protein n=1 Tax=Streptomyces sp. NPDC004296 TaxID=3364697 RepID=UPI0036C0DD1B
MPKDPHVSPSSSPHTSGGPGGGGPKDPLKGPKGPVKGPGSGRPNSSGPAPLRDGANRDGVGSSKPAGGRCKGGDPIDLVSGEMILTETDVRLPGLLDLVVERTHLSSYRYGQWFGGSWASTLDQRLEADERGLVLATQFPAGQLDGAVADHLVGVHVGLRPGARLPHVEREVIVQSARDDFVGHPLDQVGLPGR